MKISKALIIAIITVMFASCVTPENQGDNSANTIQLIRNATLKIKYGGTVFLIDPILSGKGELKSVIGVNKNPTVHLTMPVEDIMIRKLIK